MENVRLERFKQVKNRQVRKLHILSSKHHSRQVNNNRDNNNRATLGLNANNVDSNEHRVRHGNDQHTYYIFLVASIITIRLTNNILILT